MLRDMEGVAMLGRKGIWRVANADKLAELRAMSRREDKELKAICDAINAPIENLDINTASLMDITTLPGIGPVTGKRIIEGRPYKNINQLLDIPGITSNKFKKLSRYLKKI